MDDDAVRERLEAAARLYEQAADELERAVGHCRRAAEHFRDREIPRQLRMPGPRSDIFGRQRDDSTSQAREHRLRAQI